MEVSPDTLRQGLAVTATNEWMICWDESFAPRPTKGPCQQRPCPLLPSLLPAGKSGIDHRCGRHAGQSPSVALGDANGIIAPELVKPQDPP